MTLSDVQKTEVRATMEQYATAYKNKDIRGLLAVFSPDICGYGSGADEVIHNKNEFIRQIRRDISQATINTVNFTDTQIFGEGRIA
ncbi:MAG TPA: nuclear transport factor 2 family protein [Methanoregula sp.]|nr:nuclear transport factor 2 family protein [Methanoregula sp.]